MPQIQSNQSAEKLGIFRRVGHWVDSHPKTFMGIGLGASGLMVAKDIKELVDARDGKERAEAGAMLALDIGLGALDGYAILKAFRKAKV